VAADDSSVAAQRGRLAALDDLLDRLAGARIGGTFNQYRETGGDDAGSASPGIRLSNLRLYLRARLDAPVLLVAEAAGWRGARYSGLCLCSERQMLAGAAGPGPYRASSRHPRGWSEPSAAVVQGVLARGGWSLQVVLANVVPTHPAGPLPHSNRPPTRAEVAAGMVLLDRLVAILRPRHVAAIGRVAGSALGGVPVVRHPSHGGAARCRDELVPLLGGWL
jgi:hypothetical protein